MELNRFQNTPYNLVPLECVQTHLKYIKALDDEALYELSVKVEGRGGLFYLFFYLCFKYLNNCCKTDSLKKSRDLKSKIMKLTLKS